MATSAHAKCSCRVCTRIRLTIDQIFCVLDIYGWLLNSYVVDFFQDNLWERLPESWRHSLQDVHPQEFGVWLLGDISCTRVWPLSLLALRQVVKTLQINRNHDDPQSTLSCVKVHNIKSKEKVENFDRVNENINIKYTGLNIEHNKLKNLFSKHVKKKKRYEIEKIAQTCANCAYVSNIKCIVDIGAGMGHLARLLAFQYGLYVTCIEQNSSLLQQASKCDHELLVSLQKYLPNFSAKTPGHLMAKLESSSLVETKLINQLQDVFKSYFNLNETDTSFGLVGLHPCGDLAPILLKLYCSRSEAKFICIVGCCYMKLSTICDAVTDSKGYPLSNYLSMFKNNDLSYTALEVACHAIEKYCDKLRTDNYEDLIVHTYRAALETILIKKCPKLRHSQVKNVKVTKDMTFEQYCNAATDHLEAHLRPRTDDIHVSEIQYFLKRWKQVIIFGTLRIMLAPLVETIILLDRFLFLSEKNLAPTLKPVFDAKLSPRNFVLVSIKDDLPN